VHGIGKAVLHYWATFHICANSFIALTEFLKLFTAARIHPIILDTHL
jgi:hypothetical protein